MEMDFNTNLATYIAFEGIDGSGKTGQLSSLVEYLQEQGYKVLVTREIGSEHDKACSRIRQIYLDSTYNIDEIAGQLLFAANASQHCERVIKPNLSKYDFIVSDRSIESSLAYSIARNISPELTHLIHFLDKRKVFPDIVFYLDIDPEVAFERSSARAAETFEGGGVDKVEAQGLKLQQEVYRQYEQRIKDNPNYVVIDCNGKDKETVQSLIRNSLTL